MYFNFPDVQKSLENQVEEISTLRAQMLAEYEQMLSVRAEVMASQSEEVEKLQKEMEQIQQKYESEMADFEQKVKLQTGMFIVVDLLEMFHKLKYSNHHLH